MEFMIDSLNIAEIKKWAQILPLAGITSNPTIAKKEGAIDFFAQVKTVRQIIGLTPSIHVQVVASDYEGIIADAHKLKEQLGGNLYIKVPVTIAGLKAIKQLKQEGFQITATAIYTSLQGLLALEAGADYLAPYYNRMENLNTNPLEVIDQLALAIERKHSQAKILAASFKNVGQVTSALARGAQAVTASPAIYEAGFANPAIAKAVADFANDWQATQGRNSI